MPTCTPCTRSCRASAGRPPPQRSGLAHVYARPIAARASASPPHPLAAAASARPFGAHGGAPPPAAPRRTTFASALCDALLPPGRPAVSLCRRAGSDQSLGQTPSAPSRGSGRD
eukprot:1095317-Prymnesium_polylepis.1